jgi:Raf kinase inhibitor-like YbhB/YbcL family protein
MKLSSLFAVAAWTMAASAALAAPASSLAISALAISAPGLKGSKKLEVSSPKIASDGAVPEAYSAYGQGLSPPLKWSLGPYGTKSFALIVEDPDAPMAEPFTHWMVWNIAPATTSSAQGAAPAGAQQGVLLTGKVGYMGPRPPPGPAHHYHFEVYALDRKLDLKNGADRSALLAAMQGHVLASGELVALYRKP